MSGSFPTSPAPSSVDISSEYQTLVTTAQSGKRHARKLGSHRWKMRVSFPTMTQAQFREIIAFCMEQEGEYGTFTFTSPESNTPRGVATGAPVVNGDTSAGSNILYVNGIDISITDAVKAGDYFKVSGHNKVYMVTSDANSGSTSYLLKEDGGKILKEDGGGILLESTGQATFSFYPALLYDVADNETVTLTNVPFTMALSNDVQRFAVRPPLLYSYEIDLIEVI